MGGAPGSGASSDGEDLQTQHIGDSVVDSCSVSRESTKTDHVDNQPTFTLESSLSSHAVRHAFPVWTSMKTSHPFIQLSSCLTAFTQGGRAAERVSNVLRSVPVGAPALISNKVVCVTTFLPPIHSYRQRCCASGSLLQSCACGLSSIYREALGSLSKCVLLWNCA